MKANPAFYRQELLSGRRVLEALDRTRVILFGVGGVGSWCAESLVRSGLGELTLVDSDIVCVTNINRQIHATTETLGQGKVEVMAKRLRAIHPRARIHPLQRAFDWRTADSFEIERYDYVIDAIDSLSPKVDLIRTVLGTETTLFGAMGASCKIDPTRIRVGSFWKVEGCPLAKKTRKRLRKRGITKDFLCVYSDELREGFPAELGCGTDTCVCPATATDDPETPAQERSSTRAQINGSAVHITAPFGFFLAALVYQDVVKRLGEMPKERGRE